MVLWSNGIDTHLWSEQLGFNSLSGHFICFCSYFDFSQTFRTYIWFQQTLVNIGPILPKSRDSWLPLHIVSICVLVSAIEKNDFENCIFIKQISLKLGSWVFIPNFPSQFWAFLLFKTLKNSFWYLILIKTIL